MAALKNPWMFDVTSLMILLGENEENAFRSARDTHLETLVAAPVAGILSYLKFYDGVPGTSRPTYLSPYGCKSAPLRNLKLENAIRKHGLLENGKYNTYETQDNPRRDSLDLVRFLWLVFSWVYLGCLIAVWRLAPFGVLPRGTWVGITNIVVLSGWSVIVRTIELAMIDVREKERKQKAKDVGQDAAIFLGERNSALVIKGFRKDIKRWTTVNRLDFNNGTSHEIPNRLIQHFIRTGTICVLVLVFVTVPNGSTTDQLIFVLLNILGQANVFFGLELNAICCLRELKELRELREQPPSPVVDLVPGTQAEIFSGDRTQIYGNLLRYFHALGGVDSEWVEKTGILPQTSVWTDWAKEVAPTTEDPKEIYKRLWEESIRPKTPSNPQSSLI